MHHGTGLRLLIVEDDERDFEELRDLVRAAGFEDVVVEWTRTASAAVQKVERETFDCLLVDNRLPDADGLHLIAVFDELFGDAAPPSILISGYPDPRVSKAAYRGGAVDFFRKGVVSARTLGRAIRRVTGSSSGTRDKPDADHPGAS